LITRRKESSPNSPYPLKDNCLIQVSLDSGYEMAALAYTENRCGYVLEDAIVS